MNKKKSFVIVAVSLFGLTACSVVDPFFGTDEGTVIEVDRSRGCSVTFSMKGKEQKFFSEARSLLMQDVCKRLRPGMTVPVVADPIYGDYPYVLFEQTIG